MEANGDSGRYRGRGILGDRYPAAARRAEEVVPGRDHAAAVKHVPMRLIQVQQGTTANVVQVNNSRLQTKNFLLNQGQYSWMKA